MHSAASSVYDMNVFGSKWNEDGLWYEAIHFRRIYIVTIIGLDWFFSRLCQHDNGCINGRSEIQDNTAVNTWCFVNSRFYTPSEKLNFLFVHLLKFYVLYSYSFGRFYFRSVVFYYQF